MPRLSIDDATVGESAAYVDLTVRLDVPHTTAVTVDYTSDDSTATGSRDYVYPSGKLTFAPGETTQTIRVSLRSDTTAEGPETFFVGLRNATNATIGKTWGAVNIIDNDSIVATPSLFVGDVLVDEKQGQVLFEVRLGQFLGQASGSPITVNFATRDGTALAGQDYTGRSGMLTFAPGESVKTVAVDLLDDSTAEGVERFELLLSSPVGAELGDAAGLATIGLSDGTGSAQPRISVGDVVVGESDGYAHVAVMLHAPSTNLITVGYTSDDVSATGSRDYVYPSGTLSFAPGETLKTVRVQLRSDDTAEGPETFYVGVRDATNATITKAWGAVTVIDNDTVVDVPQLHVDDLQLDEKQGSASFVVRLGSFFGQATTGPVTVAYTTRDAGAVAGEDYLPVSGTLTFQPGESVKTVLVDLVDDTRGEGLERFELVLANPVNAALGDGLAVAAIALSDGTGSAQPRISIADVTVGESDAYADVVVSLHAPSTNPITVGYTSSDASASGSRDYVYPSGTLSFAPGETLKTVRVLLRSDTDAESLETFYVGLRDAANASIAKAWAAVDIVDNDTVVDTPALHVADVVVDERQGTAAFVVRLGAVMGEATNGPVTVAYTTRDGTAVAGQDYVARSGTLTFQPGQSTQTVVVDLVDDTLAEAAERFSLVLRNPVNARLGDAVAAAEIGLSDGTGSAQPRISVADVTVGESDAVARVVVSLHAPSSNPVTVGYTSSDGTATGSRDYVYPSGTLTFAPGETVKAVDVLLRSDLTAESTESFQLVLRSPVNATIARSSAVVTVVDDDGERPLLGLGRSHDIYTVDSSAVDFIEAADGGFDVVRASVSFTLPATLEGVVLTGTASNATGHDGANFFQGNARANVVDGRGGIDTMAFAGPAAAYTVTGSLASRSVASAAEGSDTLLSIERLQFADTLTAFDTTPGGHVWGAYAMLRAAFGAAPGTAQLSQWTAQLDQLGGSLRSLAQGLIHYYAPGVSNEVLVSHLWSTLIGGSIGPADLATYTGLIDSGVHTQASLLELVTTLPLNTDHLAAIVGQPLALDPAWFALPGA